VETTTPRGRGADPEPPLSRVAPYDRGRRSVRTADLPDPEVLMNGTATALTEDRAASSAAPSVRCNVTYFDDWARVTASGRLDVSTVAALRRMVLAAAVLPISGVTVDLAGVDSVDRYAVNTLVELRQRVRDHSAAFALAAISQPVLRALKAVGVSDLFNVESPWSSYPDPNVLSRSLRTGEAASRLIACPLNGE
jgi:anti-anti-sigma factor